MFIFPSLYEGLGLSVENTTQTDQNTLFRPGQTLDERIAFGLEWRLQPMLRNLQPAEASAPSAHSDLCTDIWPVQNSDGRLPPLGRMGPSLA